MDEVGFEITRHRATTARRRSAPAAGCICRSTRRTRCWCTPRRARWPRCSRRGRGYAAAQEAQPAIETLRAVSSARDTRPRRRRWASTPGQSATSAQAFVPLGAPARHGPIDGRSQWLDRAPARARSRSIPRRFTSRVTFAWSVEEETGLGRRGAPGDRRCAGHGLRHRHVRLDRHAGGRAATGRCARSAAARCCGCSTAARSSRRTSSIGSSAWRRRRRSRCSSGSRSGGTDARAFSAGGADRRRTLLARALLAFAGRGHGPARSRRARRPHRRAGEDAIDRTAPAERGVLRSPLLCSALQCYTMPSMRNHVARYGTWTSPLTAARVTAGSLRFDHLVLDGDDLYWLEGRASEGGRNVIVRRTPDGRIVGRDARGVQRAFARARVRRRARIPSIAARLYFSNFADQRLYRQSRAHAPEPLTPSGYFYADCRCRRPRGAAAVRARGSQPHDAGPGGRAVAEHDRRDRSARRSNARAAASACW